VWKPLKLSIDTSPELVSAIFSGFWRRISVVMTRALSAWFSRANMGPAQGLLFFVRQFGQIMNLALTYL
jgi:hypothetical protein